MLQHPWVTAARTADSWTVRKPRLGRLLPFAFLPLLFVPGLRDGSAEEGTANGVVSGTLALSAPVPSEPTALFTPAGSSVPAVLSGQATPSPGPSNLPAVAAPLPGPTAPAPGVVPAVLRDVQGLSPRALASALDAVSCARARGISAPGTRDLLTIIDYSLPSTRPRLWVLDLAHGKVLFNELVAHGAGSGDNFAVRFSNVAQSRESSLGLFLTGDTYQGGNGYSLRLRGLDAGVNDLAEERNIVMHGAWYVSADHARSFGRLGRSWGCPALPPAIAPAVIDAIKGGTFLYSYAATGTATGAGPQRASAPAACAAPEPRLASASAAAVR
jgi:L,D-transpeptidase catalytic domain